MLAGKSRKEGVSSCNVSQAD